MLSKLFGSGSLSSEKEDIQLMKLEIEKLKEETRHKTNQANDKTQKITPDIIREKAKRIINTAREHASQHKRKAEKELSILKREINKMKNEKMNLAKPSK